MLIATQGKSVTGTQKYFEQVLTRGDYYLGHEIAGHWQGKGAELLGLGAQSKVTREQFNDLLRGKHPVTGKKLTQRIRKDRRPGMDLTFSVPKSVSLAWAINGDERVIEALREAVHETMSRDVEPLMQRRVREGRHAATKNKTRTGKLIYADFLHKTSRPVEGQADPHLHIHVFVINWTEQDGQHYAGEFEEIVRRRPSLQARFEARLARALQHALGYAVEHSRYAQSGRIKSGWELAGLERPTIEKFSRRTAQVEAYALEHGVTDAAHKGSLGKRTREKKDKGASLDAMRTEWRSRLSEREREAFARLAGEKSKTEGRSDERAAAASVQYALEHHLYRESTVERHQLVATALEHGVTLKPEAVERAVDQAGLIERSIEIGGDTRQLVTTREVLAAEKQLIDFAREGRGTRKAIGTPDYAFSREWLNDQQMAAVRHVLECRDTVMAISGGAGTGKSSLMEEAAEAIRGHGKEVFTFAPSTGAKDVLKKKGFDNAQTAEHLIRNTQLQAKVRDQVIWVDEAGLLDVRSMNAIFSIAKDQNARVVLSGDTRQHSAPRRGEAMRMLDHEAGLKFARVEAIQRQTGRYKEAVELISKGHEALDEHGGKTGLLAGFDLLDAMGKITEIASEDRQAELAKTYVEAAAKGRSTLVVSPTHGEAASVTAHIRDQLRERGQLEGAERSFSQLKSMNLTDAQKGELRTYAGQDGLIVQFHQNAKGIKRGSRFRVTSADGCRVMITSLEGSHKCELPLGTPGRFDVYEENSLRIATGDKLRFTLGGTMADGKKRISNGRLGEVKGFDGRGNIVLKGGGVVSRDYGHLDLGYVITSHASQGKDRQLAIAAMGADSLPAINAKQFYVTVSRGSEDVRIFVDDKRRVRRAIERSGEQLSATELVRDAKPRPVAAAAKQRARTRERVRQGRRALHAFRDRVAAWWRAQERGRASAREKRERDPAVRGGPVPGFGMTPEFGRSR